MFPIVKKSGCVYICSALKKNNTVASLELRGNNLKTDSATAIADMLKLNKNIQRYAITKLKITFSN